MDKFCDFCYLNPRKEIFMPFLKEDIQFEGPISFAFYETDARQIMIHCHDCLELNLILGGTGHYIIENSSYLIEAGDIFLINNSEHHMAVHDGSLSMLVFVFDTGFIWDTPEEYGYVKPFFERNSHFSNKVRQDSQAYPLIRDSLLRLQKEYLEQREGWPLLIKAYLMVALGEFYRYYQGMDALKTDSSVSIAYARIRNVVEYIHAHFDEPLTLSQLADYAMVSKNYLSAIFSDTMKLSLFDYIEQVRVNHARLLLQTTEESILNIALKSGFHSSPYFNRVFKKLMHMTPGQYRKSVK